MPKQHTIGQIKTLLNQLSVKERKALVRRAQLRSVDGNAGQNHEQNQQDRDDIICQPSDTYSVISELSGKNPRPKYCSTTEAMPRQPKTARPPHPITNIPRTPIDYNGGVPDDTVTMEIFALRRRNEQLQDDLAAANTKITRALELLFSLRRFLSLWINDGQGETYDQVNARMHKIDGTIRFLEDRMAGQPTHEDKVPAWKK